MAALPIAFGTATVAAKRRVFATTATKGTAGPTEEKSLLDWILGGLQKEDQLLETDPLLNKVEGKAATTTTTTTTTNGGRGKSSVAVPAKKKNGGFGIGGLFAKN